MKKSLVLILASMSLFNSSGAAELKKINICIPQWREELVILNLLLAKDRGYFKKHNLEPNFVIKAFEPKPITPGATKRMEITQTVGNNFTKINKELEKCDFATTSIETFYTNENLIAQVKPLQMVAYGGGYDTHLVVSKDSKINSIKDLVHKKIRFGLASTYVALDEALKKEGSSIMEVSMVDPGVTQLLPAIRSGKIDGAISYFPTMQGLLASGEVKIIAKNLYGTYLKIPIPKSLLFTDKKFSEKNPELVNDFMDTMKEVQVYSNQNPSQLALVLKKHAVGLGLPEWNISTSNIEKIDEFYAKFTPIYFDEKKEVEIDGKKYSPISMIEGYNKLLKDKNYVTNVANFQSWE